ncbi:hypothetical protein ACP70R_020108 [Stipagrostis hirtigluma subsp. patula]
MAARHRLRGGIDPHRPLPPRPSIYPPDPRTSPHPRSVDGPRDLVSRSAFPFPPPPCGDGCTG